MNRLNIIFKYITFISILLIALKNIDNITIKKDEYMNKTQFIPEEFHKVILSNYRINTDKNLCTPGYPNCAEESSINQITINCPKQIIYSIDSINSIENTPLFVLPVCLYYHLTERRSLKYFHLQKVIHIKKTDNDSWQSGEVLNRAAGKEYIYEKTEEEELITAQKVAEAQSYSDDELESSGWREALNFDLFHFINYPSLTSGRYEIYFSFRGMESNHCFVDIIIDSVKDVNTIY